MLDQMHPTATVGPSSQGGAVFGAPRERTPLTAATESAREEKTSVLRYTGSLTNEVQ